MPPHRSRGLLTWVACLSVAAASVVPLPAAAQPVEVVPDFVDLTLIPPFFGAGEFTVTSLVDASQTVVVELANPFEGFFYLSSDYFTCWERFFAREDDTTPIGFTERRFRLRAFGSRTFSICGIPSPLSSIGGVTIRFSVEDTDRTVATRGVPFSLEIQAGSFHLDAEVFTVDSEDDAVDADPGDGVCATATGDCTLRAAVQEANATPLEDAIVLPEGSYTLSVAGANEDAAASGDLDVTDALTIYGPGADLALVDGAGLDRVFHVIDARLRIERVGITGGSALGSNGGGIYAVQGSRLELLRCAVFGNEASAGGGIFSEGILSAVGCTVSGNSAATGGGIAALEPMVVLAPRGVETTPDVTLTNTTLSGNAAEPGAGGGLAWLAPPDVGSVRLEYVTVTNNEGGGLAGACPGCIGMRASIVANQASGLDCVDAGISEGYTLDSDGSCDLSQPTDLATGDPQLGPLADNGGATLTHALLPGSPGLAAVPPADCTWDHDRSLVTPEQRLPTDQRAEPRPQQGSCEIGAFEFQPTVCALAPVEGCVAAAKAKLAIQEKKPGKEKLSASLAKFGAAVVQSDFGDPVADLTRFDLCVYDAEASLVGEIVVDRGSELCGKKARPCWTAKSDKGFKYKDGDAAADGVKKLLAKGGNVGKGSLKVQAGNKEKKGQLSLPTGIALDLEDASQATVQMLSSDGACFEAVLTSVKKADGLQFKAKTP